MNQICPNCRVGLTEGNICPTCGPVEPVMGEPPAAAAAPAASPSPARPAGPSAPAAPAGNASVINSLFMMFLLVALGIGGYLGYEHYVTTSKPSKAEKEAILGRMAAAIEKADWPAADKAMADLRKATKGKQVVSALRVTLKTLRDESSDLEQGFLAIEWLEKRTTFELNECGRHARVLLEVRVAGMIEKADKLADEGKVVEATELIDRIPKQSERYERLKKDRIKIDRLMADRLEAQARKAFSEKRLDEADVLVIKALNKAIGGQRPPLLELQTQVDKAISAEAKALYNKGEGVAAVRLLEGRSKRDVYREMFKRISTVTKLAKQAEKLTSAGSTDEAKGVWRRITELEKDASNAYLQRARDALK